MWNLRVLPTLLILANVYGLFCVALKLQDQDVLDPEEKTCSGESCPEDESSNIDFMSDFLDLDPLLLKTNEINEGETMPVDKFLEVTDHKPVSREKNEKEVGSADGEKDEIRTDGPKDIILNKLLKNAGQQKPNKLQGPSLIARYVQGVRGAVGSRSSNGDGKIEEKKKVDDTTKAEEAKQEMHEHEHINFMSDFLDMDPLSMKKNEGADLLTEDSFENVTDDQGSMVNLTENQDTHLDFMADFLDEDHMHVQLNQSEDSDNVTDTAHIDMQTNVTDISENDTLSIDDNVTESSVNGTVDTIKDQDEKQIDFLANLLEEDLLENVSESESIESDSSEIKGKNEENGKSTGHDNELDFVTDFLSSDPFDTEAIDRSDAVEINAVQEENLDFLTDFLSEDPASVQSHPDEEIPQDILELYSEDEVVPEQEEVYKRKKPISSNIEWAKEEAKKEPSSVWNWFGF